MVDLHGSTPCRSCHAQIFMVLTKATGSLMPINADPDPAGNIRVELTALDSIPVAVVIKQDELFVPEPDVRYMPHWATCTDPDLWRKR